MKTRTLVLSGMLSLGVLGAVAPAQAQDRLCDPANENCRNILINYIRNETVGIDVAFWFMEDPRYTTELIARHNAGVPIRVLMDVNANPTYPANATRLQELRNAGIPMRERTTSSILHWKMMLFHGQNVVEFSGANYSPNAWLPQTSTDYENYIDEAIYFTSEPAVVDSFRTKFEDHWVSTSGWTNYANVTGPLTRRYPITPKDPSLNFPPEENYRTRSVARYNAERKAIDIIMYRITDQAHTNAILNAVGRGIPVRLITEQDQYRDVSRMWHAWNVDRLYVGGVQIRHRGHAGLNHQKSVILHDQQATTPGDQTLVIFGSSNWTSPSAASQVEHNLFTTKPYITNWFIEQFERKWNNLAPLPETMPFTPLPPDAPKSPSPANSATGAPRNVTFRWNGGPWAHLYDLYLSTNSNPTTLVASNLAEPTSKTATSNFTYTHTVTLAPGTRYYWKVVGKTMAMQTRSSPIWSFTTESVVTPPDASDIVIHAASATAINGGWRLVADSSAAGGTRLSHPNSGAAKLGAALANPTHYFEMTFNADAGRAYRLWIRGKADANYWANDSAFVQFSGSVTSGGTAVYRIGTTSAADYNLEDCSGCGVSGWGWQDNGWGVGVFGPLIYFANTGQQTVRIQTREDGLSIDQVVLSPDTFLSTAPGSLRNDTTILPESDGSGGSGTAAGEIAIHALNADAAGAWRVESDTTAAGGAKLRHPNGSAAKLTSALANPVNYFELSFEAEAGRDYRLWIRGQADNDYWGNDSLFVQFSGSVNAAGSPIWRIGTTSAAEYNLEDCSGCGIDGWGWQDNGWGVNVLGPTVRFATSGEQAIRVQTREDGLSVDQIVLSPGRFLNSAPGALKNDDTILPESGG